MSSSEDVAQQFIDGGVVLAELSGNTAATKSYVDTELAERDALISANTSGLSTHIGDSTVHVTPTEKATYNAHIADGTIHVTPTEHTAYNSHIADTTIHVTSADHTKLNGIAAGAEVNQNAFSVVNDISASAKTDTVTFTGGTGITVSTNSGTKTVTITATGSATPGAHASSHITGGTDVIPDAVTGGASGLMSGADATFVRSTGETKTGAQAKADAAQSAAIAAAATNANSNLSTHAALHAADGVHGLDSSIAKFKAGSSTYTDNDNAQTFTDSFCTANSLVVVSITSVTKPQGSWTVDAGAGSFTITSSAAESADITFDYYILKVVG